MAKIHVLEAGAVNTYRVAVHIATPAGNNSAGVAWSAAVANSGRANTVLSEGNGPGQISTAEMNQIQNGSLIEGVFDFTDNPADDAATRNARLDQVATQTTNELLARYQRELKYWGATRS